MEEKEKPNIDAIVQPLAKVIKEITEATTVVVLIKNKNGSYCIGNGKFDTASVVFSIASHLAAQLGEIFEEEKQQEQQQEEEAK